jgi:phospholipase C
MPARPPSLLATVQHIVVLMLENRSLDHRLGFLHAAEGNKSPRTVPRNITRPR